MSPRPTLRRALWWVATVTCAIVLGGCSLAGQASPIWGYRLVDADTIDVKASTAAGWETWLASVRETATTVVIEMRTKAPQGAGAFPAQDMWVTVELAAPLGDRSVIDAAANTAVQPVP